MPVSPARTRATPLLLLALMAAATPATAADAVSVAVKAVNDIYVRPLRLKDVAVTVTTDPFDPASQPGTVFIDLSESCCVSGTDPAGREPLLRFAVIVRGELLRSIAASGRLIDQPAGRSVANADAVEREVVAAIRKWALGRAIESSEVRRVSGRDVRRVTFRARGVPDSDRRAVIDLQSRLPVLIDLPPTR